MNHQTNLLAENLKNLFGNEQLSDGNIHIIEVDSTEVPVELNEICKSSEPNDEVLLKVNAVISKSAGEKRNRAEVDSDDSHSDGEPKKICEKVENNHVNELDDVSAEKETLIKKLPVHLSILTMQSEYFNRMICGNNETKESRTKTIKLKVKKGEGVYAEHFIHSFYNHNLLFNLSLYELLCVMGIADRYLCDVIIQQIGNLLTLKSLSDLQECERIVQHLSQNDYGLPLPIDCGKVFLKSCEDFASKMFCPLENKIQKRHGNTFYDISYELLQAVLQSKKPLTFHENSLLFFVEKWLQINCEKRTEENIGGLLTLVNYKYLTPEFLSDVITEDNKVFGNWCDYKAWFIVTISYHALKRTWFNIARYLCDIDYDRRYTAFNELISCNFKFENLNFKGVTRTDQYLVYEGYKLVPSLFICESKTCPSRLKIILKITTYNFLYLGFGSGRAKENLFKIPVALTLLKNFRSSNEEAFRSCSQKGNSLALTLNYTLTGISYFIGRVDKQYFESSDQINLIIACKHKNKPWPNYFPQHLKTFEMTKVDMKL